MARPDLEDVPVDHDGRPLPPEPTLEGPEWKDHRPPTADEEAEAWKVAQITATLMGRDFLHGLFDRWEDAVRCGSSLLEISRRLVMSEAKK